MIHPPPTHTQYAFFIIPVFSWPHIHLQALWSQTFSETPHWSNITLPQVYFATHTYPCGGSELRLPFKPSIVNWELPVFSKGFKRLQSKREFHPPRPG